MSIRTAAAVWLCTFVPVGCSDDPGGGDAATDASPEDAADDAADLADGESTDGEDSDGEDPPEWEPDLDSMWADLEFLADPALAGRETGTPGNRTAVDYVESRFLELGLEPAGDDGTFLHGFDLQHWTIDAPPDLTLDGEDLLYGDDYTVYRYSAPGTGEAELVWVGYGIVVPPFDPADHPGCRMDPTGHDDLRGADLTGRIALVLPSVPGGDPAVLSGCPVRDKLGALAEAGAIAMVTPPMPPWPGEPIQGITLWHDRPHPIPAISLDRSLVAERLPDLDEWVAEADRWDTVSRLTGVRMAIRLETSVHAVRAHSVVGRLPGTHPVLRDEVVLVGGHLDHVFPNPVTGEPYPGADDNGSGTVTTLELARAVVTAVPRPARTVVFAAWNAEEQGLLGACAYAEAPPTHALEDLAAVFNMDAVGGGDGTGLVMFGATAPGNRFLFDRVRAGLAEEGLDYSLVTYPSTPQHDAACFETRGVPIMTVQALGDHPYAHTVLDTADRINPESLRVTTRMVWLALRPMALGL